MSNTTVKVGDFFYTSWGYDQTQVDFYKVVGFTPSGKSVRIQPWSKRDVADDRNPHASVIPGDRPAMLMSRDVDTGEVTSTEQPTLTVRLRQDGGTSTTIHGHWAGLWDGKPKYQTGHAYGH